MRISTLLALVTLALSTASCGGKSDGEGAPAEAEQSVLGVALTAADGPRVSAEFVKLGDNKATVTVFNRHDQMLSSVRVRFHWLGADDKPLATATGRPLTYPVQKASTGLVGKMKQNDIEFPLNTPPPEAKSARVEVESAQFADKSKWKPEKK